MTIDAICSECIEALVNAGYNQSTITNYKRLIGRFKIFCKEKGITEYSCAIGKEYSEDVVSPKTGKFSMNRYKTQGRFVRLLDSYFKDGVFNFSMVKKGNALPDNEFHKNIYRDYHVYLQNLYENDNTRHFYEYGMYRLLQFMNKYHISDFKKLHVNMVMQYIKETKPENQREILCQLRGIFRYLNRKDLLHVLAGIHAPRIKRIVPTLTCEENQNLKSVIEGGRITLRDAAIVIMGLSCGIRACDLINLKLSDIDWENETITFKQSKTGNLVCLPLTICIGNALAKYISEERPNAKNNYLFVREVAPFEPLANHTTCYGIVSRVFKMAGIEKSNRIFGMHMLRHNAASTMVKNEIPIETISAILGHSSSDTTDIYITTDEQKLRDCVLPMIGISKEVHP